LIEFAQAGIPCTKEPLGLSQSDGKRPDGLSLLPWEAGKPLTGRNSHLSVGRLYVAAAVREAVESLGPFNASGRVFLSKFGRKLADLSGDDREINFLFQRLSILIQRYNAILLHDFCEGEGGIRFIPA